MRKYRRGLIAGIATLGLFAWAACGDDDGGALPLGGVDAAVDVRDSGPVLDATEIIEDEDASDAEPPEPVRDFDAGPDDAVVLDAGDGGVPCVGGGELEIEDNDSLDAATPINPPRSRCGIARVHGADPLDAGPDADADAEVDGGVIAETDLLTFTLSAGTIDYYVQYKGDVSVVVQVGADAGARYDITKPDASLPFQRKEPFYIEVRSITGRDEPWRISVFEVKPAP